MKKYLLALYFIVIIGGLASYAYIFSHRTSQPKMTKTELPLPNVPIQEFVLGGTVRSFQNGKLVVTVGKVYQGTAGNYVDYEDKTALVSSSTLVIIRKTENGKYTKFTGKMSDIVPGSYVNMYSKLNIATMDNFTPIKIEIMAIK